MKVDNRLQPKVVPRAKMISGACRSHFFVVNGNVQRVARVERRRGELQVIDAPCPPTIHLLFTG
jgi:hypothetical protein